MPKPKSVKVDVVADLPNEDFSKLSDEQILELLEITFSALCAKLEDSGVEPQYITGALFSEFANRMAAEGDRSQFEEILEEALEIPWEDYTLH